MKRLFLALSLLTCGGTFAQTPASIKLNKGQQIAVNTSMNMDMDLGMGTMKTDNNVAGVLQVIGEDAKSYTLTMTVNKMKMSMDGMGQSMTYDSDKPEDANSEVGKSVAGKLNVSDTFFLDKSSGIAKRLHEEENKSGGGMMAAMQGQSQTASDAFLIIPAGIKMGGSWDDSMRVNDLLTKRNFTWVSSDKNIATIKIKGSMTGTMEQEMQGMNVTMGMDLSYTETRTIDTQTGMVLTVSNDSDMKNTMDSMGMSMSTKMITNSTYKKL